MPCTCNAICDNDCNDSICTGHSPACVNSFIFSVVPVTGDLIRASDVLVLQAAINAERLNTGRRYNASPPAHCSANTGVACSNNAFSVYPFTLVASEDEIDNEDFDDIKEANNEVTNDSTYGALVTANFIDQAVDTSPDKVDSIIKAIDVVELQNKINQTRNVCICDSHCNCDGGNCGCNGECPSDDYYYYYYYP